MVHVDEGARDEDAGNARRSVSVVQGRLSEIRLVVADEKTKVRVELNAEARVSGVDF